MVGKHRMLDTVHAKINIIDHKLKEVIEIFKPLVSRGIPFFWEEKGPLLTQEEYLEILALHRADHDKFGHMYAYWALLCLTNWLGNLNY